MFKYRYSYIVTQRELSDVLFNPAVIDIMCKWDEGMAVFVPSITTQRVHPYFGDLDIIGYSSEFRVSPSSSGYSSSEFGDSTRDAVITVRTNAKLAELNDCSYTTEQFYDFPAIVTELEKAGVVKCSPSESYLADDPRVFHYRGEEYQVDCLGGSLCQDITDEVVAEFKRLSVGV